MFSRLGVLDLFSTAIANDLKVGAYSVATFNKGVTVYNTAEPENPPTASEYPVVVLEKVDDNSFGDAVGETLNLGVGIAITDNSPATETVIVETEATLKLYPALEKLDTLRKLVEAVILSQKISAKITVIGEISTNVEFPFFASYSVFRLESPKYQRSGR